jgi:sugar lactone lactonase YvrE
VTPLFLVCLIAAAPYESTGFLRFPAEAKKGVVSGVDIDRKGNIYVLHRGELPVAKFDAKGRHLKSWGEGLFKVAHAIKAGPDGNIWTTDNGNHVIRVFTPEGQLLRTIGEVGKPGSDEAHFRAPDDIGWARNGHYYVADAGNARIIHFDGDGRYLGQWGKKGKGPGEFSSAHSLTIDADDKIYVGDRGNQRIQVFDAQGAFLAQWTGFGNPFGMAVVGKGREMLSSDGDNHKMYLLDKATGKILEAWGGDKETFQLPHLMAVDKKGRVYLAEVNGGRLQILKRTRR